MTKKVGLKYDKKVLKYRDCITDRDRWCDSSKYLPEDYDLCLLKTGSGKIFKGWLSGSRWDGKYFHEDERPQIISWKKLDM